MPKRTGSTSRLTRLTTLLTGVCAWTGVMALDVNLTETRPYVNIEVGGQKVRIQRIQDQDHVLTGFFAKTSRPCPPFCIHPMQVEADVVTVGEVEVLDFIARDVRQGSGLLVDARTPDWYAKRTIPGSINLPWTILADANPADEKFLSLLGVMGVVKKEGGSLLDSFKSLFGSAPDVGSWDFSQAKDLLLFCNGPWCDQSPRAIRGLLKIGYPAEKLRYYRGGMNMWELFGLTTIPGT